MLELAEVKPGELVYDLGCGDGRIIILAATEFGARAIGIEIRKDLVERCREKIRQLGLEDRVRVIHGDMFKIDIGDADVVTLYLLTSVNKMLRPKLEKELKHGARVVSHDFEITGWKPVKIEELHESWRSHKIYLYVR